MNQLNLLAATLLFAAPAFAQSSGSSFDVATIKKAADPQPGKPVFFGLRGGPGTADPGRISWSYVNLRILLMTAYDVMPYQISGPEWIDSERFEIVAKVPAGATKGEIKLMWQKLLAERFGLVFHRATKVFPAYEITSVKGSVRLKETTLGPNANPIAAMPKAAGHGGIAVGQNPAPGGPLPPVNGPQLDKNGIPQLTVPGLVTVMTAGSNGPVAHLVGKAQTTAQLATNLTSQLNKPVVDKTGLTGTYDFVVDFTPDFDSKGPMPNVPTPPPGDPTHSPSSSGDLAGTTLIAAVQQQLGLKLVSTKIPLDVLVIDKAEKTPTEN